MWAVRIRCGWMALILAAGPGTVAATELPSDAIAARMAARVDALLEAEMRQRGITPAERCDDAEFLRRVHLDLTGVIPTAAQVREFLADPAIDKRVRCIERLLASPRHPTHLATTWRRIMLPADSDPARRLEAAGLQRWLRDQFAANLRYDRLVAEFISASGQGETGPTLFYRSLEVKPEKLAAATSRIFLGLQIQCAECHDHPFDHWTQRDFWGYAAFFAQLPSNETAMTNRFQLVDLPIGEVRLPDTNEVISPNFPGGRAPPPDALGTRRRQLAIWMASRDNPFLAPSAVNRVWQQMFGRGLVNPVDNLGTHNPPSHPQLLDELVEFFVNHQFDLPTLYRVLARTEAYQRSSSVKGLSPGDASESLAAFARMPLRPLTADQLFDSLQRSLGTDPEVAAAESPVRARFVALMESTSPDPTEYDLGLPQALQLMNGEPLAAATNSRADGMLAALAAPWWDDRDRVEILFLATLSRFPRPSEVDALIAYLKAASGPPEAARGDLLWALINSAEYQINH